MDHLRCWEEVRWKESWKDSKFDSYSLRQQQGCDGVKLKARQFILFLTTAAFFPIFFLQMTVSEKLRRKFGARDGSITLPSERRAFLVAQHSRLNTFYRDEKIE